MTIEQLADWVADRHIIRGGQRSVLTAVAAVNLSDGTEWPGRCSWSFHCDAEPVVDSEITTQRKILAAIIVAAIKESKVHT